MEEEVDKGKVDNKNIKDGSKMKRSMDLKNKRRNKEMSFIGLLCSYEVLIWIEFKVEN